MGVFIALCETFYLFFSNEELPLFPIRAKLALPNQSHILFSRVPLFRQGWSEREPTGGPVDTEGKKPGRCCHDDNISQAFFGTYRRN